jgi:hypothetical protein
MLERGGNTMGLKQGRRFQSSPSFVFTAYVMDSRSRIAQVSVLAAKVPEKTSSEPITVADVKEIIVQAANEVLDENNGRQDDQTFQDLHTKAVEVRLKTKQLIDRLVPFSKELRGSPIYFALERKKLMSMLTSPAITTDGPWTWFTTFAAPEVYESTLYEVASDAFIDPSQTEATRALVKQMDKSRRLEILKESPALSARLFHYKQEALWNKVILGHHQPLGPIGDWWRRVEVK